MTEHETLVAAKSYLLNHGWTQQFGGDGEPRCLLGALCSAAHDNGAPIALAGASLIHALRARGIGVTVVAWNDDEGRSFDDVITLLDEAILAAAPQTADEPEAAVA